MKQRVYVDTSAIGGIFDPEFKEWSEKLEDEFRSGLKIMVISDLILKELEDAPDMVRGVLDHIPKENKEYITLNDEAKQLKKDGIPEDEVKRLEDDIQKLTDKYIKQVDELIEAKEKDMMSV